MEGESLPQGPEGTAVQVEMRRRNFRWNFRRQIGGRNFSSSLVPFNFAGLPSNLKLRKIRLKSKLNMCNMTGCIYFDGISWVELNYR